MVPYQTALTTALDDIRPLIEAAVSAGEREEAVRLLRRRDALLQRLEALAVEANHEWSAE